VGRNALLSAAGLVHDQVVVVVVSGRLDDRGGDLITYSAVEESDAQELQPCRQPAVAARPSAEDAVPDAVCRSVPCNHLQVPQPAMVVIVPGRSTLQTRWLLMSAM
jgi:hypothetical protein